MALGNMPSPAVFTNDLSKNNFVWTPSSVEQQVFHITLDLVLVLSIACCGIWKKSEKKLLLNSHIVHRIASVYNLT